MTQEETYGVRSSFRKGDPSVRIVYKRVANIRQPSPTNTNLAVVTDKQANFDSELLLKNPLITKHILLLVKGY